MSWIGRRGRERERGERIEVSGNCVSWYCKACYCSDVALMLHFPFFFNIHRIVVYILWCCDTVMVLLLVYVVAKCVLSVVVI